MATLSYGHFDDSNREFVITNPATPFPWINYLGCEDFFSLISNTAGGYSFYKDAKFRRITRYRYNGVPMDNGGKYFYIKDGETIWSPGWKPCKTPLDRYECRHGMGYTRITGEKAGVEVSVLYFVPVHTWAEIQKVSICNKSGETKHLKLFSFVEWCLWNAATDMENFQRNLNTGEVEVVNNADFTTLYHKTEYRERRNHFAYYSVNTRADGFDTDRKSFIGLYNGFEAPEAVIDGESRNSVAHGWSPVASHCVDMVLKPGETRERVFILGYAENKEDEKWAAPYIINKVNAENVIKRFATTDAVDEAFAQLKSMWNDLLGRFTVKSDDERMDRMVNIWNQYQCMITFCFSRSASFFESGIGRGMGFRDSNQDLLGFVHQIPSRARQRIIDIASTQFPDGGCYHQYQPLTKRGNNGIGGGFNDDPMWLIFGTVAYIKETGDFSILNEKVPFDNVEGSEVTLMQHLRVSFMHVVEHLGPHGLPLIGRADWNDCLNLNCFSTDPDESFQTTENKTEGSRAESLMIAGLFVYCGRQYVELLDTILRKDLNIDSLTTDRLTAHRQDAQRHIERMVGAVEQYGWDGEWYLRAYDFFGNKIGSADNPEGKIFIESQGWCSMAEIGKEMNMPEKALDAVKRLLDCEYGMVLNFPAYSRYHIELGEQSSYPMGYKENGGIFCHNNPWVIIGETLCGRGDDAWEHYAKIAPSWITDQHLHCTEPYVYAQCLAGKESANPGEAKNSWLTGTAAWNWLAVTQHILGIQPQYDGLTVNPCLPRSMKQYTVTRRFREAVYTITVLNPDGKSMADTPTFVAYEPGEHTVTVTL